LSQNGFGDVLGYGSVRPNVEVRSNSVYVLVSDRAREAYFEDLKRTTRY